MIPRIAALWFACAAALSAVPVYIGTDTGPKTGSKGIYLADFNPESGQLTAPQLAAEYRNPGFLARHPTHAVLLAIGAPNTPFADGGDSVAAFAIAADHSLKFLGEASTGGKGACHLAVAPDGRTVAVANYGDGHISTIRLDDHGVPGKLVSVIVNQGAGPNPSRQKGPHAHGVYFDKLGTRLFVPDLGVDQVRVYPCDPASSALGGALPSLVTAPGAGPRHLAFSADGKNAYVINELDNTLLAATCEAGAFTAIGTVPTLPKDFTAANTTAEVEVSPDDRFVYASNRGHDSIAVFCRNEPSGALTFLQYAPCGGKTPRHFKIAPGGKWLLCAHMESHTISVLPLDPESGTLATPVCTVSSPNPICILFAR